MGTSAGETVGGVTIRAAQPADLAHVVKLATAFYRECGFGTTALELHDNLAVLLRSDAARVAVADRRGDVLGFAITTLGFGLEQGAVAELEDLFIQPAHRRTGGGRALIRDSAAWARSRGCRTLELVVAPHNANADHLVRYYARHNFTDQGRRLLSRNLTG